ncbi:MAG: hypothetical protein WC648_01220 [Candidatus Paceibacterota bacterium]|jgi:hypothetical protein
METEETVVVDTTETTTPEVTPEVTTPDEGAEESIEEVKEKLTKAEKKASDQEQRAIIAEKKLKDKPTVESKPDGLSSKDIIALSKADVHEDDLDEVLDYAKYKKISIGDALKSNVIKTLLKDKQDERKTAAATNTGTARRGSVKVSDEEIVDKSTKGQLPEDPEALAKARWNLKKKK